MKIKDLQKRLSVPAPAKINLFLHILGKRDDGYHLLESLVVFTEYGDVVTVEEASELSLEINGEFASELLAFPKEQNLVWKTALAVQKSFNTPLFAKITLTKNLPIASGIGGGSADAAATIIALCKLWKLDLSTEELHEIALKLGSDVPICLNGKTAMMRGVGEQIEEIEFNEAGYIVLINPLLKLSTAEVFSEFKIENIDRKNTEQRNDLEQIAIKKLPIIAEIITALQATEGCISARMSGSGATCFGLYKTKTDADNAKKKLIKQFPKSWCVSSKIL